MATQKIYKLVISEHLTHRVLGVELLKTYKAAYDYIIRLDEEGCYGKAVAEIFPLECDCFGVFRDHSLTREPLVTHLMG